MLALIANRFGRREAEVRTLKLAKSVAACHAPFRLRDAPVLWQDGLATVRRRLYACLPAERLRKTYKCDAGKRTEIIEASNRQGTA